MRIRAHSTWPVFTWLQKSVHRRTDLGDEVPEAVVRNVRQSEDSPLTIHGQRCPSYALAPEKYDGTSPPPFTLEDTQIDE